MFDDSTADNRLNRVFRFVVERLWRLTRDAGNKKTLGELREQLDEATLLPNVAAAGADQSILNRTNSRYAPLLNLARFFLSDGAPQLFAGSVDSFAFVFDMNRLFEIFLSEFVRRHRTEILPDALKSCDLLPQTRGATRFLASRESGGEAFQLKPDLALRNADGSFPLIVDAKYKKLKEQNRRSGISPTDFYQMHAYAHWYECSQILLIYPQTAEMQNNLRANFRLQNSRIFIQAATINLQLRLAQKSERARLVAELHDIFRSATENFE